MVAAFRFALKYFSLVVRSSRHVVFDLDFLRIVQAGFVAEKIFNL